MPVVIDSARMAVNSISNQTFASYKALSIHFVVHHHNHLSEAMGLAAQEILWHPAAENALHFLQNSHAGKSKILGMAYAQKSGLFTTGARRRYICICNLNLGQYDTLEELKRAAWFFTWHAINHLEKFESDNNNGGRNKSRNSAGQNENIVPIAIHNAVELTGNNLCADTFSAIMAAHEGDNYVVKNMAVKKAETVLQNNARHNPEYYAFPMAVDAVEKMIGLYKEKHLPKRRIVSEAMRFSSNMRDIFDDDSLKHWISFAGNAQNMIWRGIEKDKTIGAAMYMAGHTQTRLIAHQICELLKLKPYSITGDTDFYNSFMSGQMADKCHNHLIDEKFEKLLIQALRAKNGQVFKEAADRQNTDLCSGEINGWCALALQYAGKAIDVALESGNDPAALAKKEFDSCRSKVTLDDLRLLNRNIILEKRRGLTIAMVKIKAICNQHEELKLIGQSVQMTLTSSPLSDKRPDNRKTITA